MNKGVPMEALDIMLSSLSDSTLKQYSTPLRQWTAFCQENSISPLNINSEMVLKFLSERFLAAASYGSLNSARSALSLISNNKIGEHIDIVRFMRGVSKHRPSKPKYNNTWDVSIVLDYLEKLDTSCIKNLTLKTAMLLALSTAQRAQTLTKIRISNMNTVAKGLEIFIPDTLKTSGPGKYQPVLEILLFKENPSLCVVSTIDKYKNQTSQIREGIDQLFVSLTTPIHAISTQTFSKWLKKCLKLSGIDVSKFTGHSTRHAATSAADESGLDYDTIRRTAGWSGRSQVFAKFYKRPIMKTGFEFAQVVLETNNK